MKDHWLLPPDYNSMEKEIALWSLQNIYNNFPDPVDKLIISWCFELGYPQNFVAESLGKQEKTISVRVKKIRTILSKVYSSRLKTE
jgi:hypothetical protein